MAEHRLMEKYCNRNCPICAFQFWLTEEPPENPASHSIQVSDAHARERAGSLAQRARADQTFIRDQMFRHGNAIERFWVNKDAQQRAKILLEVQPDLYRKSYAQIHIYYGLDPCKQQNRRNAQLLPYLNLSTLQADPIKLLGLLHHRSNQELEKWVMFDMGQIHLTTDGVNNTNLKYNENCVILHGKRYGELVSWDRQETHEWRMIGYMMAVHILEAQAVLMSFLRRTLEQFLVQGCDLIVPNAGKPLCIAAFRSAEGNEYWSTRDYQAYSSGPTLCLDALLAQAKTELRAALDHVRLLQTDPEYLQSLVATARASHRALKLSTKESWVGLAMDLLCFPLSDVVSFTTLVVELKRASDMYQKCKHRISLDREVPYNYKRALSTLYLIADIILGKYRARIALLLCQTPGFRRHYHLRRPKGGIADLTLGNINGLQHAYKQSTHFSNDPLHFALCLLSARNPLILPVSHGEIEGFIKEHLHQAGQSASNRMTQLLNDHISRLLVVSDLWSTLRVHRPGIHPICFPSTAESARGGKLMYCCWPKNLPATEMHGLATLLQDCCATRWPSGPRDKGWLQKSQVIRTKVSAFWARAREFRWAQLQGSGLSVADMVNDVSLLAANRSDEHLKYLRKEIKMALAHEIRIKAEASEQSVLQTVWGEPSLPIRTILEIAASDLSNKKGTKKTSDQPTVPEKVPSSEDKVRTLVYVSRQSLSTLTKMYPSAIDRAAKATVKWTSFVAAMVDAGFTVVPSGGSAVHFNRNNADGGGAIVFHKPHPDSSISPIMLQVMGKRLGKWFGWGRDVFVERSPSC